MKNFPMLVFALFFSIAVFGQEKFSLYGDAGGASPVMSINLDKRFHSSNSGIGFRAGIGLVPG